MPTYIKARPGPCPVWVFPRPPFMTFCSLSVCTASSCEAMSAQLVQGALEMCVSWSLPKWHQPAVCRTGAFTASCSSVVKVSDLFRGLVKSTLFRSALERALLKEPVWQSWVGCQEVVSGRNRVSSHPRHSLISWAPFLAGCSDL